MLGRNYSQPNYGARPYGITTQPVVQQQQIDLPQLMVNLLMNIYNQDPNNPLNIEIVARWAGPMNNWVSGEFQDAVNITKTIYDLGVNQAINNRVDPQVFLESTALDTINIAKAMLYHRQDVLPQIKEQALNLGLGGFIDQYIQLANNRDQLLNQQRYQPSTVVNTGGYNNGFNRYTQPLNRGYQQPMQGMSSSNIQPYRPATNAIVQNSAIDSAIGGSDITSIMLNATKKLENDKPAPVDRNFSHTPGYVNHVPQTQPTTRPQTQVKEIIPNAKPTTSAYGVPDINRFVSPQNTSTENETLKISKAYGSITYPSNPAFNYERDENGLLPDEVRFLSFNEAQRLLDQGVKFSIPKDAFHVRPPADYHLYLILTKENTIRKISTKIGDVMPNIPEYADALKLYRDNPRYGASKRINEVNIVSSSLGSVYTEDMMKLSNEHAKDIELALQLEDIQARQDALTKASQKFNKEYKALLVLYATDIRTWLNNHPGKTEKDAAEALGINLSQFNDSKVLREQVEEKQMATIVEVPDESIAVEVNDPADVRSAVSINRLMTNNIVADNVIVNSYKDNVVYTSHNTDQISKLKELLAPFYITAKTEDKQATRHTDATELHSQLKQLQHKLPINIINELDRSATEEINRCLMLNAPEIGIQIESFLEDYTELLQYILEEVDESIYPSRMVLLGALSERINMALVRYTREAQFVLTEDGTDVDWMEYKTIVESRSFNAAYISTTANAQGVNGKTIVIENAGDTHALHKLVDHLYTHAVESRDTEAPIQNSYLIFADNQIYEIHLHVDLTNEFGVPDGYILREVTMG